MKISSVLIRRFLQYFCQYRRTAAASNFTDNLGFCPFCRFFSTIICSALTRKWSFSSFLWKFLHLYVRVRPYLHLSVPFSKLLYCSYFLRKNRQLSVDFLWIYLFVLMPLRPRPPYPALEPIHPTAISPIYPPIPLSDELFEIGGWYWEGNGDVTTGKGWVFGNIRDST